MTEVDWGSLQKEAANAGVYPDGQYNVIVIESTATTSSNGKPMIKVKARITDGPKKDKPIWTQFTVSAETPIALRFFFEHMAAFGLDSNFFGQNPPMADVARNLLNRGAIFELETSEWKGAARNQVAKVLPLPAGGPIVPGMVATPPQLGLTGMTPVASINGPAPTIPTPNSPASAAAPSTPVALGVPPATPF